MIGTNNVFICLHCDRAYVLPSCCSHYQDAKIKELELKLEQSDEVIKHHGHEVFFLQCQLTNSEDKLVRAEALLRRIYNDAIVFPKATIFNYFNPQGQQKKKK